jgi:hypothetical protein
VPLVPETARTGKRQSVPGRTSSPGSQSVPMVLIQAFHPHGPSGLPCFADSMPKRIAQAHAIVAGTHRTFMR